MLSSKVRSCVFDQRSLEGVSIASHIYVDTSDGQDNSIMNTNRRSFLQTAAAAAAATSLPNWYLNELAQSAAAAATLTDVQPAIALIGCGGMGKGDARNASRFGRIVALCDVDDIQLAEAKKLWPDAETYKDFRKVMDRKDIQVVICGTVDHWHTLVSLAHAGLTGRVAVEERRLLREASDTHDRRGAASGVRSS